MQQLKKSSYIIFILKGDEKKKFTILKGKEKIKILYI